MPMWNNPNCGFQKGHPNFGFKKGHPSYLTEESKKKISKALKGRKISEKQKKWLSEYRRGKPGPARGRHLTIEQRMELSKSRRGENGSNWRGGLKSINESIRAGIEFRLWREVVFARDNWICQKTKIKGGKLHPHHIQNFAQWPELRFAIDNGITLSKKAHGEFHKKYGLKNNTKEQLEEFLS